jgi:hypothetical protein
MLGELAECLDVSLRCMVWRMNVAVGGRYSLAVRRESARNLVGEAGTRARVGKFGG